MRQQYHIWKAKKENETIYFILSSLKKSQLKEKRKRKRKDGERQYYDGAKRCQ